MTPLQLGALGAIVGTVAFIALAPKDNVQERTLEPDNATLQVAGLCEKIMLPELAAEGLTPQQLPLRAYCLCVAEALFDQNGDGFFVSSLDAFLTSEHAADLILSDQVFLACQKELLAVPA